MTNQRSSILARETSSEPSLTNGIHSNGGNVLDAFVPEAGALALEGRPGITRDLRRLLFWAMADQGFTAYVEEWWHFDFGNQFWGSITGHPAIYGPICP